MHEAASGRPFHLGGMMDFPPLDTLGRRIMICGPSNSGKSTLAQALSRKLGVEAVYIDLLRHKPNTDWELRPDAEFHQLHTQAVAQDAWVMEGNYTALFPERLPRATGIILIHSNRWSALGRYVHRTLFERKRAGALAGNHDSLKLWLAAYILVDQPRKAPALRKKLKASGLPMLELRNMRELNRLYAAWGLTRR